MKYEDIKDFTQRCEEHPAHQTGMVSYQMIQDRLSEEIDELRAYIEQRPSRSDMTWVGLDLDERSACYEKSGGNLSQFADAIEAKLKEKNDKN